MASGLLAAVTCEDENRTGTRGASSFDVARFISDEPGSGKVKVMFSRCFQQHPGRGLAARGRLAGRFRRKVHSINDLGSELAKKFALNSVEVIFGHEPPADSALVRDQKQFESCVLQLPQGFRNACEYADLRGVPAILHFFH